MRRTTKKSFIPISLTAASWVLIVIAILTGGVLYFVLAFNDMGWQLLQLLIAHEVALALALMLRAVPHRPRLSSALLIPSNDAAAVELVRHVMNNVNQRFFNSFVAL